MDRMGDCREEGITKRAKLLFAPDVYDHPRREERIVQLANLFGIAPVREYRRLPEGFKEMCSAYPYFMLLRPLVLYDRQRKELSYPQLCVKYELTERQVRYLVTGK